MLSNPAMNLMFAAFSLLLYSSAPQSYTLRLTWCRCPFACVAVLVGSTKTQLQTTSSHTKLLSVLHFNSEGQIDMSRIVDIAWIPGTNASSFAAAHLSGNIHLYQTVGASLTTLDDVQ